MALVTTSQGWTYLPQVTAGTGHRRTSIEGNTLLHATDTGRIETEVGVSARPIACERRARTASFLRVPVPRVVVTRCGGLSRREETNGHSVPARGNRVGAPFRAVSTIVTRARGSYEPGAPRPAKTTLVILGLRKSVGVARTVSVTCVGGLPRPEGRIVSVFRLHRLPEPYRGSPTLGIGLGSGVPQDIHVKKRKEAV